MKGRSFQEILLLLLTAILAAAVTPFAVLRILEEQWATAILDTSIVVVMLGLFLKVYFTHETKVPGFVVALSFIASALGSLHLQGMSQLYWLYPALTAAFFLLSATHAMLLCAASLLAIWVMLVGNVTPLVLFTVSLTILTNILFAYAFALTAKRQNSALELLATKDPLTGAGNRRAQNEKLDAVNAMFRRSHTCASVLILDVDHFKKINDTHGHIVGDEILVELADLIRANIRPTDNLYRYGGEEFIVIAEHTDLASAQKLAEKLRVAVENNSFTSDIKLTVSFGVAELQPGEGRQGWLGRADSALFNAKGAGRNRVNLAQPTEFLSRVTLSNAS
ncbi:MAG: GGDEF domain-containing protein [Halioglobus sp.]